MFLLDSNILIYYLDGAQQVRSFVEQQNTRPAISVISVTELLSKPHLTKHQQRTIEDFLSRFAILEVTAEIAKIAAAIKRKYSLKAPDAIVAATAVAYKAILVSRDIIFRKVSDFKTINPFH